MYLMPDIRVEAAVNLVGKGWTPLVLKFYEAIKENPLIRVNQIKEKFGGLRIYFDHVCSDINAENPKCTHNFDALYELTDRLSEQSYKTCERCGAPGELRTNRPWVRTLCNECIVKGGGQ